MHGAAAQPAIAPTGPRSSRSTPSGGYTRFVDEIVALGAEVQRARCAIGEPEGWRNADGNRWC